MGSAAKSTGRRRGYYYRYTGRLIALLATGKIKFDHLEHLMLDEADRMLDMGFYDDIVRS